MMSFTDGRGRLALTLSGILALFGSGYGNWFYAAPASFFASFQKDSEALVVGKLVADKYGLSMPQGAHLGYASVPGFTYLPAYISQSYALLDNSPVPELTLTPVVYSDANWRDGLAVREAAVAVPRDAELLAYVGHLMVADQGPPRQVRMVEPHGAWTILHLAGPPLDPAELPVGRKLTLSGAPLPSDAIELTPYVSQVGLQGIVLSYLYRSGWDLLDLLRAEAALAYATAAVALAMAYAHLFSLPFAVLFAASLALSPWMVACARNLYWVPVTWFLPALAAAGYALVSRAVARAACVLAMVVTFALKCLAGYEFISTIILFAAAPFAYAAVVGGRRPRRAAVRGFSTVCASGVLGFACALVAHARMRGPSVAAGLRHIYEFDVKRRTYGSPAQFGPQYTDSLLASPWAVLETYLFDWRTDVVKGISGDFFWPLCVAAFATVCFRRWHGHPRWRRDAGLLFAFGLPPLSWFVLAKAHSHVHGHLNFVLWSLGTLAALGFVAWGGARVALLHLVAWVRRTRAEEV